MTSSDSRVMLLTSKQAEACYTVASRVKLYAEGQSSNHALVTHGFVFVGLESNSSTIFESLTVEFHAIFGSLPY